jgi:sugar phosphate isomerase/epimerase
MISVGIFTGYYPYKLDEVIRRIKASDFNCVQLDISFKDFDATKEPLTREKARWIRDAFRDANLPIIAVSATPISSIPIPRSGRRTSTISR